MRVYIVTTTEDEYGYELILGVTPTFKRALACAEEEFRKGEWNLGISIYDLDTEQEIQYISVGSENGKFVAFGEEIA